MPYITRWNLARVYNTKADRQLTVKRLSGDLHTYSIVEQNPAIHSVANCTRLSQPYGEKLNSGSSFVINYPVKKLNDTSFDEIDGGVENFTTSLYFHLGFSQCFNCWNTESLNEMQRYALENDQEQCEQHERDLEQLNEHFKNHPDDFEKFLGLD